MGALAVVLPFIPSILNLVEHLFKKDGVKTGPDKMDAAMQILRAILTKLGAVLPGVTQPTDEVVKATLETVLQQIQGTSALTTPQTPLTPSGMWLLQGSVTELKRA